MMTVKQMADRLNDILVSNPRAANTPFTVKITPSPRIVEYHPIAWVSSSTLGITCEGQSFDTVEATAESNFIRNGKGGFHWES